MVVLGSSRMVHLLKSSCGERMVVLVHSRVVRLLDSSAKLTLLKARCKECNLIRVHRHEVAIMDADEMFQLSEGSSIVRPLLECSKLVQVPAHLV
jgi:hypothetical protein